MSRSWEAAVGMTWRARWAGVVAAGFLLALAGCGGRPGIDGDLTNDWPAFPEPTMSIPVVGQCRDAAHVDYWFVPDNADWKTVDCSVHHILEVVHVGQFSAAAPADSPPPPDSSDERAAFAECDRAARDYVGGDWHTGRIALSFSPPTTRQWRGGARFFSCSLYETSSMRGGPNTRTDTLKAALAGDSPLSMHCFDLVGTQDADGFYTQLEDTIPESCEVPHNAEYAGWYLPPDGPYPTDSHMDRRLSPGCESIVANFLGLSPSGLGRRTELAYLWWVTGKAQWTMGNRTVI